MGGQRHAPAAIPPGKTPVSIVKKAGWAPGTVWTDAENLAPTGIRSPDRPIRSESLYRMRYPGHTATEDIWKLHQYDSARSASPKYMKLGYCRNVEDIKYT